MAEAVAPSLLVVEQVIKLINYLCGSHTSVVEDVYKAKECLERMKSSLKNLEAEVDEARVTQIRRVAYSIEDALDEYFLRVSDHSHTYMISRVAHDVAHAIPHRRASSKLASEMVDVQNQIDFVLKLDKVDRQHEGRKRETLQDNDDFSYSLEENETVGFEEMEERLLKQFTEMNSKRLAISIVGPAGSGKTTLVKSVYKSNQVRRFFSCHAWVDVPRPFEFNKALLSMLRELEQDSNQENTNLKDRLERLLSEERFVIVLDNIRSKEDLESIVSVIPNGLQGSKIISTSCNSQSSYISTSEYTHDLKALPYAHAWSLFCNKAFHKSGGNCPEGLEMLAQQIMKKCEGLPFAISAVGAALATKDQTSREWKSFHDSLGRDVPIIRTNWEHSYKDLPSNLKTCFLYFGMFPEDYSISRERLTRLWVAEGFVIPHERRTLEQVAEGYLKELVERNLVVVTAREINGSVKLCRVLNLVREFIIPKAKHFITVFEANNRESILATQGNEIRRLSVQCNINLLKGKDLSLLRTLLVFGDFGDNITTYTNSTIHKVLKACRLLKVLDLQGTSTLKSFPKSIESLTLLRYLNLSETQVKTIPTSIKKLGYLESLDLKQTKVTTLPQEIDRLQNLRNLLAYRYDRNNYVSFRALQGVHLSACNIGALTRMQKLSLIRVPMKNNVKFIKALGELKGLKRLGLRDLRREDGAKLCIEVQKMKDLSTFDVQSTREDEVLDLDHMSFPSSNPSYLQHLYMKGRLQSIPKWVAQLHSLVKVGLKWSKLKAEVNPFEALENLPNLMKLELVNYYEGKEITFKAETFKKLMVLILDQFEELNFMVIESNAMPMLEKLIMSRCHNLKLLPVFGLGDLQSLQEVRLYDMCPQFIANFKRDGEDREVFQHVGTIKSFSLQNDNGNFSGYENLSPSQWTVRS